MYNYLDLELIRRQVPLLACGRRRRERVGYFRLVGGGLGKPPLTAHSRMIRLAGSNLPQFVRRMSSCRQVCCWSAIQNTWYYSECNATWDCCWYSPAEVSVLLDVLNDAVLGIYPHVQQAPNPRPPYAAVKELDGPPAHPLDQLDIESPVHSTSSHGPLKSVYNRLLVEWMGDMEWHSFELCSSGSASVKSC